MSDKPTTQEIERINKVMNKYIAAYFDGIQKILDKKETSIDIDLDIRMKIYSEAHRILVQVKRELTE